MPGQGRVTIAEVAREAGVSKTTVSLVLNGAAEALGIREATRANVRRAMTRLGYTPNHAARSLRRRRTNVITLLVQDLANPCFTDISVAARDAAESRGYELTVVGAGPPEAELRALEHLRGGTSDGVIVGTGRHSARGAAIELLRDLVRRGLPAVILLDRSPDSSIPAIRVDVEGGSYEAVTHLIQLGHRRIAHLALQGSQPIEEDLTAQGDRYRAYRGALADAGREVRPEWVIRGPDTLAGGRRMMHELLALPGPRPTATFVYNDLMAIGALGALREAGVSVPGQMALVAFDGIELGEFTTPPLSTLDNPRAELGRLGVEAIFDLIGGGQPPQIERLLPVRLLVRESCGGTSETNRQTGAESRGR